jgi:hypothetical protein
MEQTGFKTAFTSCMDENKYGTKGVGMWGAAYGQKGIEGPRPAPSLEGKADETTQLGQSEAASLIELDDRPVILIGGRPEISASLANWSERAGLRCIGLFGLAELRAKLDQLVMIDALLLDLRGLDQQQDLGLLASDIRRLRSIVGTVKLAIIADLAVLDEAVAQFDGPETEFLCDPGHQDIISLLVMTALTADEINAQARLKDSANDDEGGRIERLSEEVRRLASTIEQLTQNSALQNSLADGRSAYAAMRHLGAHQELRPRPREPRDNAAKGEGSPPTHAEIRALLRARRMREQFLPGDLFADPAWDMILDLLAARLARQRVSVSSLCIAASVPPTTALRWIRQLTDRGILSRIDDPEDGRRVFIDLTEEATDAVLAWAQAVRRNGGLLSGARSA